MSRAPMGTCEWCFDRPVWGHDPKRPEIPWNTCLDCLTEYVEGQHRVKGTLLRLPPLDLGDRQVRSVSITVTFDEGDAA